MKISNAAAIFSPADMRRMTLEEVRTECIRARNGDSFGGCGDCRIPEAPFKGFMDCWFYQRPDEWRFEEKEKL